MKIVRRVGASPRERGCGTSANCPDVFEMSDGSFAIIGREVTEELGPQLPADAGCGPDERIVIIPRETFLLAKADALDS